MKFKRMWIAVPTALALALTACSGGTSSNTAASGETAGDPTRLIKAWSGEPQNPLIPANTNEVNGAKIINQVMAGLVYYDLTGKTKMDVAESITSDDDTLWTVKLQKDRKFSDGTPVKAHNFVDAWKMGAKEAMLSASFYADIEGADDEGNGDLTGLNVVDDYTFTIKLKQPVSDWPDRMGYAAYFPLADSTLTDPEAGGEKPVGNGPYMLESWTHQVGAKLLPNPHYVGDNKPKNNGIDLVFYTSLDAAYQDLSANNLDILDAIPDSAFTSYMQDLQNRGLNQPSAVFQAFTIGGLDHFTGEEGKLRRQAISMAINREEITEAIFAGTRTPAKDFTSPVVDGFNDKIPGNEVLKYNPEKAKELWAKADAISPWSGSFKIAYNSDGGHQAWVDAVANQLKNTLGIDAGGNPYADFKSFRSDVTKRLITTAFRAGWQADYPGQYNFLAPLYGTGGSANDGDYSNPEVDSLLKQVFAGSHEDSIKTLEKIQQILFTELPSIPLWYANTTSGWSANVENVKFKWDGVPDYVNITVK
ncbi:peptide ABC transporter substrate-binding protein [Schaalia sp. lx-260]|uniref:peptide ABC transporter substrate-binding protein n=1 Tax=Schaalia sp. lx-260 TaxID=2899082 RepID=UPI001E35EFD1|nr:ABC transporter substrate-binding protein [Schaalia sp. lx-260]MCD4550001.1 ABC transporter substrate-binding protein [Schaalia sp. lx-260]